MNPPLLVFFTNNLKAPAFMLAGDNTQQVQAVWILITYKQALYLPTLAGSLFAAKAFQSTELLISTTSLGKPG